MSLPAKAMAKAKVPKSTTHFSTGTLKALSSVITTEKATKPPPRITHVFWSIIAFSSGVMMLDPFNPLINKNHIMLVTAMPPKMPIFSDEPNRLPILPFTSVVLPFTRYVNVNTIRATHCTNEPNTKAIATLKKMPKITLRAFSVFNKSPSDRATPSTPAVPFKIFINAMAKAPPSSSNTILTVVEVGIPMVLKMSSRMISVTITARKTHITS